MRKEDEAHIIEKQRACSILPEESSSKWAESAPEKPLTADYKVRTNSERSRHESLIVFSRNETGHMKHETEGRASVFRTLMEFTARVPIGFKGQLRVSLLGFVVLSKQR